jgi:hypothetical protein
MGESGGLVRARPGEETEIHISEARRCKLLSHTHPINLTIAVFSLDWTTLIAPPQVALLDVNLVVDLSKMGSEE